MPLKKKKRNVLPEESGNPTRTVIDCHLPFALILTRCVPSDANLVTTITGLTVLTNRVYADLTRSLQIYDDVFQRFE